MKRTLKFPETLKENILDTVNDLVDDFVYYDRKDDAELPEGLIDQAVIEHVITIDEIVEHFKTRLIEGLKT